MHYLYILYSKSLDKYYTGETSNIKNRLEKHILHHFQKGYTKAAEDWEIVLEAECISRDDAIYLEKFIKRMKSKKFIEKVIKTQSILQDILSKK